MSRYDKERIIGSGSFGNVWLVKSKLSRHSYVLKEIDLKPLSEIDREHALNEVAILSKCKHKHIIRYKDTVIESGPVLSIVMEYAEGGDLHSAISKQNGIYFEEHQIISWFIQICLALQYIHYRNILHRDLKSQNIFLTRSKTIKVGDFGIARVLQSPEDLAKTSIGTPYYLSPEICKRAPYNHKSDIWALGCILFEMAALEQAFQAVDFIHLLPLILRGKRKELPRHCSALIKDLVNSLLDLDPERRPSTGVILDNPLLQPYLSDYMSKQSSRDSFLPILISPKETYSRRGSVSGIFENLRRNCKKRRSFSTSEMIPQLTTSTARMAEQGNQGTSWKYLRTNSRKLPIISQKGNFNQKQVSQYRVSNSKHTVSLNKKEQSVFTVSCDTYSVQTSHSVRPKIKVTKPESPTLIETDYGYQSCNPNLCSPNSLKKDNNSAFKSPSKMQPENVGRALHALENGKSLDGGVNPIVHSNCEHLQCHRCMLDMLWNNRIRCYAEGSVNTDEYLRLKDKLVFLYKEDLFEKIYFSLLRDCEENKYGPSTHLLGMMQSLNFEQVQSLPLMMQLVQLDLFLKSKQNSQDVCDIMP